MDKNDLHCKGCKDKVIRNFILNSYCKRINQFNIFLFIATRVSSEKMRKFLFVFYYFSRETELSEKNAKFR